MSEKLWSVPRLWPGADVFLVAGGPSLTGFDWERLRGRKIIAVNRAFEVLSFAQVIYFTDYRFFEWHRDGILAHPAHWKIAGNNRVTDPRIRRLTTKGKGGLSTDPAVLHHGANSGYAAINLAVLMGAARLILLGYDLGWHKGRDHWHENHLVPSRETQLERMLPFYETLPAALADAGVEVVNCSPISRLTMFTQCDIDAVLPRTERPETMTEDEKFGERAAALYDEYLNWKRVGEAMGVPWREAKAAAAAHRAEGVRGADTFAALPAHVQGKLNAAGIGPRNIALQSEASLASVPGIGPASVRKIMEAIGG